MHMMMMHAVMSIKTTFLSILCVIGISVVVGNNAGEQFRQMKQLVAVSHHAGGDLLNYRHIRDASHATPSITDMYIQSDAMAHFAKVVITSIVVNKEVDDHEASFTVQIPSNAFISNFTMLAKGVLSVARVEEKSKAEKIYEDAKMQGQSAGHVVQKPPDPGREMDIFSVTVNIAAQSACTFQLSYHELLERRQGKFIQRINIEPKQIVTNLTMHAIYNEPQGFADFQFQEPQNKALKAASTQSCCSELFKTNTKRELFYRPSIDEQAAIDPKNGISGEFLVRYDINHGNGGGIIIIDNDQDYFVHYVNVDPAPDKTNLPVLSKNIVFIIDISGSMAGRKINQTRQAMIAILKKLRKDDYFNILLFSGDAWQWKSEPVVASDRNKQSAMGYVLERVQARGSTNINNALLEGLKLYSSLTNVGGNIIIFLTDGEPTAGETVTKNIRHNVMKTNKETARASIFSLGFGFDVDFEFLKRLSWENGGFARRIYEDIDADKQLEGFFEEVESPLLLDVEIKYDNDIVDKNTLTRTSFRQYFKGSELVVVGKLHSNAPGSWPATVEGKSIGSHEVELQASFEHLGTQVEKLTEKIWAYQKIKDLIRDGAITDDLAEKSFIKQQAINLSIEYHFVTPLTSMVVTEEVFGQPDAAGSSRDDRPSGRKYKTMAYDSFDTVRTHNADRSFPADSRIGVGEVRGGAPKKSGTVIACFGHILIIMMIAVVMGI